MGIAIFVAVGAIIGAMMGSFACCQVRRMRRKEKGEKPLGKWSVCEKCGKRLKKRENIPVISWLVQRGKCTKCGARIGVSEILSEVGLAAIFGVLGYVFYRDFWQGSALNKIILGGEGSVSLNEWLGVAIWILIAVAVVLMWMITIYDAKWGEMPTKLLVATIIVAVIVRLLMIASSGVIEVVVHDGFGAIGASGLGETLRADLLNLAGALAVLPGLYLVLYICSRGKLVGDGDWLLALAIALLLGNWWLAFFELFFSNALASIAGIGAILKDRKKACGVEDKKKEQTREEKIDRKAERFSREMSIKIPFGPYLVVAFVVVMALAPILMRVMIF